MYSKKFNKAIVEGSCDVVDGMLATGHIPPRNSLILPCQKGDINMLTRLLQYDMDLGVGFLTAVTHRQMDVLNRLYVAGVDINCADVDGNTALHHVVDVEICKWLLDMGAVHKPNNKGLTPSYYACQYNRRTPIVALFLEHNVDVDKDDFLSYACMKQKPDIVALLLDNGAKQTIDKHGTSPLDYACMYANVEIAKLLLDHIHSNSKYEEMVQNPMSTAIKSGKNPIEFIKLLFHYGFDQTPDDCGFSPLNQACATGNLEVVKLLVQHGADQTPSKFGRIPFHIACYQGHIEIVEFLLELDPGLRTKRDTSRSAYTSLTHACIGGNKRVVELLLSSGDHDFEQALQRAKDANHMDIVEILNQHRYKNI